MAKDASMPRHQVHDQHVVVDFFRWHVKVYGNDWRALGWQSRYTQFRRFAILADIGTLTQRRVLDVGCGLGDLYSYFETEAISVDYSGYDLLPEMVKRARKRFPQARFEVHDVLRGLGEERFDYILSSGAFNVNFGNNLHAVQGVIRDMFAHSERGVAINFIKRYPGASNDPIFYYYDPQEMLTFCRTLCPHARLREGYLPNDFTLYLYP